ncbi:hypothetical protein EJ357_46365 [Streptomyces cyaneochromogenes]|uniref:Uncharacterized protein n=1 Tax=Streptomyces cyaneochromogenes TaxID=2496836 RepID=A0A3S9ML93_9ACTN|nr:hypothetical protein EJ357_46365 [Streptomyces cyaneochromogenes]
MRSASPSSGWAGRCSAPGARTPPRRRGPTPRPRPTWSPRSKAWCPRAGSPSRRKWARRSARPP